MAPEHEPRPFAAGPFEGPLHIGYASKSVAAAADEARGLMADVRKLLAEFAERWRWLLFTKRPK